ncbi:MAG: hypothetical protein IV100_22935 [Myxococcales bacterium]|nr:hypothetical protein [Myxococcales bacterium]
MIPAPWPSALDLHRLESRAAAWFGLGAESVVLVGGASTLAGTAGPSLEALPALVTAYVGDGVVALAEPTHPALPESVLLAGARYLDVGRDHAFRVDVDGLRWATRRIEVRLAWFLSPDWPTGLSPAAALISRTERAGLLVVVDERLRERPSRSGVSAGRIRLASLDGRTYALSAPETLLPLRRASRAPGPIVPSGAECAENHDTGRLDRLAPVGEVGTMAALRAVGVPSLDASRLLGGGALGSARWTWRDLVVVPREGQTHKKAK